MSDSRVKHLWRWHPVLGHHFVVEFEERSARPDKSFTTSVYGEGLADDVVRHSLRHTAATWVIRNRVPAGCDGMGADMIEHRYGHHSAKHMEGATEALGWQRRVA